MAKFSDGEVRRALAQQMLANAYIGHLDISMLGATNPIKFTILFDEMVTNYDVVLKIRYLASMYRTGEEFEKVIQKQEFFIGHWRTDNEVPRKVTRLVDKAIADLNRVRQIYEVSLGRQANW